MTIDDKLKDGNLQYEVNRAAAKVSALSPDKLNMSI